MIQKQTQLIVADNTGARKIMCIGILGSNKIMQMSVILLLVL